MAWAAWNGQYTYTTTSTTTNYIPVSNQASTWISWNNQRIVQTYGTPTATYANFQWQAWNYVYEETAEQQAAREEAERQAAEWHERDQQCIRELEAANKRAEELLLSLLTDEQAASYREHGYFEVRGSRGGRYRIRNRGQSGNIDLMPEIGEVRDASLCVHPPGMLPAADAHVAQLLTLVTDEDHIRRRANVQYRRTGWREQDWRQAA